MWGIPAPEGVKATWGARAILQHWETKKYVNAKFRNGKLLRKGYWDVKHHHDIDLVPDRQSSTGEEEAKKALFNWLDNSAIPELKKQANILPFRGDSYERFIFIEDGFHLEATPNGSFGYLYIGAWKC
jgi:hypothetical protein